MGRQTVMFANSPILTSTASIVGPLEGDGLLAGHFDKVLEDSLNGHDSWEKCESFMLEWAIREALAKELVSIDQVDFVLAGDLLNQLMASHFALRSLEIPFIGLYGACSTKALSLLMGSMFIDGGFGEKVVCAVSSHHNTAERQYRFPTELGVQRNLLEQWTVTGAGASVISAKGLGPKITSGTIGKIVDLGIKDTKAMGPAMAPAAADTLFFHFQDTGRDPTYYDMIYSGDLGYVGKQLLIELLQGKNLDISKNYEDCGCMIYKPEQDDHSGASGCASSAIVFCGYLYEQLKNKQMKKILLVGTGSLHSPTSALQDESIPCIAHAVSIEMDD